MASTGNSAFAPDPGSGGGNAIFRTISRTVSSQLGGLTRYGSRVEEDEFSDEDDVPIKSEDWKMMPDVKRFQQQGEKDHMKARKLGVTWQGLTVKGVGSDAAFNENAISQFNIPQKVRESRQPAPLTTIIDNSTGCVKPGEMLLVLGRPGAGCTTLLKMLSNRRLGYAGIEGDIRFGSMDHKAAEKYRGQIVMNTEEELFFPTLTVQQTIDFATRLKVPFHLPSDCESPQQYYTHNRDFLLASMGVSHTANTKVGNEYVRGVSGGERKRVSIMECMATRGSVFCWDNSTRGLDASTALEFVKAIRALTDILGLSSIITLYQAGNGLYNLFDEGECYEAERKPSLRGLKANKVSSLGP